MNAKVYYRDDSGKIKRTTVYDITNVTYASGSLMFFDVDMENDVFIEVGDSFNIVINDED